MVFVFVVLVVVLFTSLVIVAVILVLTGDALCVVTGDVEAWCVIKGVGIRRGAVRHPTGRTRVFGYDP